MINNKLMNKIIMFKKKKRLYKLNYPSLKKNRFKKLLISIVFKNNMKSNLKLKI